MHGAQAGGQARQQGGAAHLGRRRLAPGDEARDDAALLGQEQHDLGREAERVRRARRRDLRPAIDAEDLRVLAAQADDVVVAAEPDAQVAVRQPAAQDLRLALPRAERRLEALHEARGDHRATV